MADRGIDPGQVKVATTFIPIEELKQVMAQPNRQGLEMLQPHLFRLRN